MKKILLGITFLLSALVANASWADCRIIPKSQCPHAELSGKSHPGVDMHEVQLLEGDLSKSDFTKANLKGANIYHGNLSGGNFTEADMTGITLYNADLTGANFAGANLTGAKLKGANLSEANLTDANLSNADIENAKFVKTTFCRTTMPNGIVNSSSNCPAVKPTKAAQAETAGDLVNALTSVLAIAVAYNDIRNAGANAAAQQQAAVAQQQAEANQRAAQQQAQQDQQWQAQQQAPQNQQWQAQQQAQQNQQWQAQQQQQNEQLRRTQENDQLRQQYQNASAAAARCVNWYYLHRSDLLGEVWVYEQHCPDVVFDVLVTCPGSTEHAVMFTYVKPPSEWYSFANCKQSGQPLVRVVRVRPSNH